MFAYYAGRKGRLPRPKKYRPPKKKKDKAALPGQAAAASPAQTDRDKRERSEEAEENRDVDRLRARQAGDTRKEAGIDGDIGDIEAVIDILRAQAEEMEITDAHEADLRRHALAELRLRTRDGAARAEVIIAEYRDGVERRAAGILRKAALLAAEAERLAGLPRRDYEAAAELFTRAAELTQKRSRFLSKIYTGRAAQCLMRVMTEEQARGSELAERLHATDASVYRAEERASYRNPPGRRRGQ